MARPHPDDIALCLQGAASCFVTDSSGFTIYDAAKRVVCVLAGQHYYDGVPKPYDVENALGKAGYSNWLHDSIEQNCAQALAMYKERYPEG